MEAILKSESRKIHVLYAHNDDMAIGAIQAIEEAGPQARQGNPHRLHRRGERRVRSDDRRQAQRHHRVQSVVRAAAHDLGHRSRRGPADSETHRRRRNRCSPWKRRSNTSRRASTDERDDTIAADRARGARHRPRLSRRAGARGRRAHAARRRSARAHGPERRRQVDADQGADRRVRARRRQHRATRASRSRPESPIHAQQLGISAVHQESHLLPNLSVAENICAGRYPRTPWTRGGGIDWRETERRARELLAGLGIDLDVTQLAGGLPAALQQLATVARAVATDARVLILDEPTSSLDADEVQGVVRADPPAARQGRRHPVRHAFPRPGVRDLRPHDRAAQRQVRRRIRLRQARRARAGRGHGGPRSRARRKSPRTAPRGEAAAAPPPVLAAHEPLAPRSAQTHGHRAARRRGAGPRRACWARAAPSSRACCSRSTRATAGEIRIDGAGREARQSGRTRSQLGLGFCPEDRKHSGIVAELSVRENIALALQARMGLTKFLEARPNSARSRRSWWRRSA